MEELLIEEKARRYDEAIAEGRQIQNTPYTAHWDTMKEVVEHLFPELAENEDERIRNSLIRLLQVGGYMSPEDKDKAFAWLAKQGEQKSDDKVKAKQNSDLEKGKWYVCDTPRYKDFIVGKAYYCPKNEMLKSYEDDLPRYVAKHCFHPWTIQDAKDGDILAEHDTIVLFKAIEGQNIRCYCTYHYLGFNPDLRVDTLHNKNVYSPATQEQCHLLFQKMEEAGYRWNSEKKELRKIESKFKAGNWYLCVKDFLGKGVRFDKGHTYYCGLNDCLQEFDSGAHICIDEKLYDYFIPWTIKDIKDGDVLCSGQIIILFKKWESDNWNFAIAYAGIDVSGKLQITDGHWLISNNAHPATEEQCNLLFQKMGEAGYTFDFEKKELKKIEQKSAWWNNEDSRILYNVKAYVGYAAGQRGVKDELFKEANDWLKALKDKLIWKPSDEQMRAFYKYLNEGDKTLTLSECLLLRQLYNDLKKLKENGKT